MRHILRSSKSFAREYELGGFLGRGAFADVWECTEKETGLEFACKVIRKRTICSPEARGDVERELFILQKFREQQQSVPGLLRFKEALESDEDVYIVTELCRGGTLLEVIESHGPLPELSAKVVFRQILSAVLSCHSIGVLHRDIKPENILFTDTAACFYKDSRPNDGTPIVQVKLIDFGLAVVLQPGRTASGVAGNRCYTAPEVFQRCDYGFKADVWSLGVVLFFMLTGKLPFEGDTDDDLEEAVHQGKISWGKLKSAPVSSEAQGFAFLMLQPWPWFRSSAAELVSHPWLDYACDEVGGKRLDDNADRDWRVSVPRRSSWTTSLLNVWRKSS